MQTMQRMGRKLELVCTLCNNTLADVERACAVQEQSQKQNKSETLSPSTPAPSDESVGLSEQEISSGPSSYAGYQSVASEDNQKNVVATKCGHMFHQGCLRKYIHKLLIEGKGGLFCPICTRPFGMHKLWPVVIPATKAQKDRYTQLKVMKEQNAEMVIQLKDIRARIADDEKTLEKIKQDSENCLKDIQQKQKLLDSVSGPTNKEMVELTKIHMKRQETLHVLTQHNADLIKLLAEESNISTSCAEKLIGSNKSDLHSGRSTKEIDPNQNYLPSVATSFQPLLEALKKKERERHGVNSKPNNMPPIFPLQELILEKQKKEKSKLSKRKSKKKKERSPKLVALPSEVLPRGLKKVEQSRTVDTFAQWDMESMKELMSLESYSDTSTQLTKEGNNDSNSNRSDNVNKDLFNIRLSRKPPMFDKPMKSSVK